MRFIDLEEIKPAIRDKIEALEEARAAVLAEPDPDRRNALIERFRTRWTALREAFAAHSHDKCWYVECRNLGTDDDMDHFRPKGGVKEDPAHPGYYWLAFEWTNLRLSCHRANRPPDQPGDRRNGGARPSTSRSSILEPAPWRLKTTSRLRFPRSWIQQG